MLWPRLTQIGGGVKQAAMLGQRVAVGHAGDEVRDMAGMGWRAAWRRLLAPFGRQRGGVVAVALEQVADHARGILHDVGDARMAVDLGREEGAEPVEVG